MAMNQQTDAGGLNRPSYNRIRRYNLYDLEEINTDLEEIVKQEEDYSENYLSPVLTDIDPRFREHINNTIYYDSLEEINELLTQNSDFIKKETIPYYKGTGAALKGAIKETEDLSDDLRTKGVGADTSSAAAPPPITNPEEKKDDKEDKPEDDKSSPEVVDPKLKDYKEDSTGAGDDKTTSDGGDTADKPVTKPKDNTQDIQKLEEDNKEGPGKAENIAQTVVTPEGIKPKALAGGKDGIGESLATSAKAGAGKMGKGILDALGKEASKLLDGISPFTGSYGGSGKNINRRSAGIIAAAGLAAGGAAGGGGLLISKNLSVLRFTPEDWLALGEDYQKIIEKLMKKVGFSNDELDVFKQTKFKILASEIKEHKKKIEKAVKANPACEDDLVSLYGFSMLDEKHKVIDYLLFLTMLIDGKNAIDEYNFYNVVNQSMEDMDDADFVYSGIYMEDYIDDEKDETEEDIQILNDPTIQKEEPKEESKEELEEALNPIEEALKEEPINDEEANFTSDEVTSIPGDDNYTDALMNKEWLQGIGLQD